MRDACTTCREVYCQSNSPSVPLTILPDCQQSIRRNVKTRLDSLDHRPSLGPDWRSASIQVGVITTKMETAELTNSSCGLPFQLHCRKKQVSDPSSSVSRKSECTGHQLLKAPSLGHVTTLCAEA